MAALPVQSSALHHVFVGDDGQAEMHRARRGRHAARTREGASAAQRLRPRRQALLPHELLVDDVELAIVGARVGRRDHHLRRPRRRRRYALAPHRRRARDRLRHESRLSEDERGCGHRAGRATRSLRPARDDVHRRGALRRTVPMGPRSRQAVAAPIDFGRHGHHRLLRARQPESARLRGRSAVQKPRSRRAGVRSGREHDHAGRARLHESVPVAPAWLLRRRRRLALSQGVLRRERRRVDARRCRRILAGRLGASARPQRRRAQRARHQRESGRDLSHPERDSRDSSCDGRAADRRQRGRRGPAHRAPARAAGGRATECGARRARAPRSHARGLGCARAGRHRAGRRLAGHAQ
ncbi:hypothetical protein AWB75_07194 [Caballeronia catudaia]|uniref:Uncharacterized protein n=1 Tax=Caballeronia catudaia TaxID=1777136 RepID=A0A158DUZ3_9BURK|nr:hypothetical protein AWB75_07194 [Caballeronia catudaia]